jgi:predicted ribosome quality control (RQC) complex YloA/Tae2 family protein
MSRQLSSFEVMRLVKEMEILEGGFLQKVYQPWDGLLVFRFNTKAGKRFLVHGVGGWAFITEEMDIDLEPLGVKGADLPPFVKLLRKYLGNGYVTGTRQLSFDRILEIGIRKELPYVLIFEMFGVGNVILNRQGAIVGALKTQTWRHRSIRPRLEYKPPPQRKDPRAIELSELAVLLGQSKADLVRTLATSVNLGGTYAEEVCHRAGLDKDIPANGLDHDQLTRILETIREITDEVVHGAGGVVHLMDGSKDTVSAIRLSKYLDGPVQSYAFLSEAIQAFYPLEASRDVPVSEVESVLERLAHQEAQQAEALVRFKQEIDDDKARADALYINYKQVEQVLGQVNALRNSKGWQATVEAFPDLRIDPSEISVTVGMEAGDGRHIEVTLDLRKDVNENATIHYERVKHNRDKVTGAERALAETRREIKRLEKAKELEEVDQAERRGGDRDKRKRFWFESNRWFVTSQGNLVVGGRDAQGNRKVVKRYLKDGDRYVHADIHGAPSIVVKASDIAGNPLEITTEALEEACHYAICFSKAWSARIGSGEAYWVNPEQVSTTPQSGEFLPKGGFIIRGKRNLVRNLELELGVGLVEIDGVELIMCAPVRAIRARTDRYYRLVPSKGKKTDVAKRLAKEFDVSIEEVEGVLPPGGMDIHE